MLSTRERIVANARYARFIAKGAFLSAYKLRSGQKLSAGAMVEQLATEKPTATALLFEDERWSWEELNGRSNQVAHALLGQGLVPGNVVALLMDNRPEYITTMVGVNKIGGCTALINAHLAGQPLVHAITIASPSYILVGAERVEHLAEVASELPVPADRILVWSDRGVRQAFPGGKDFDALLDAAPRKNLPSTREQDIDGPFLFIYTSGTTGLPKAAAVKTSRFLKAANLFGQNVMGVTSDDVVYGSGMPLYHSSGSILGWGASLTGGAPFAIRRKFSARGFWEDVDRWGVTIFGYIGELCRYLLNSQPHPKERGHRVRAAVGAGLRPEIWKEFETRFAIPKIYEFYGATEGNVGIVNIDSRPGMLGRLFPGQAVFAADPHTGELLRGPDGRTSKVGPGGVGLLVGQISKMNSFDGYVDRSKNDSKILKNPLGDGKDYFNTGDLVQLHEHGYVSFKDRLGDTFRWKAENVSTNEVQEVLNRHAGVAESNVYGVAVPGADGKAGMASIVSHPDFDLVDFAKHVREGLPTYARPIFLRVQTEMQTTGTFKHMKTELKEAGYDPAKVDDALYFFENGERYVSLTAEIFADLNAGRIKL